MTPADTVSKLISLKITIDEMCLALREHKDSSESDRQCWEHVCNAQFEICVALDAAKQVEERRAWTSSDMRGSST